MAEQAIVTIFVTRDESRFSEPILRRALFEMRIVFRTVDVSENPALRSRIISSTGSTKFPQLCVNNGYLGGFDKILELISSGELSRYLKKDQGGTLRA